MQTSFLGPNLSEIYNIRFSVFERVRKNELWKTLCTHFLQQFVKKDGSVLDVGAGSCEFINAIHAKKKFALDLNPITKASADTDVTVLTVSAERMNKYFLRSLDVIFVSNFLEHLENKATVYKILKKSYLALRPGGKLLIMQPDIHRVGNQYWDFFDHTVPLTERSVKEALLSVGFNITNIVAPFLPYTTNTKWLPQSAFLLRLYLKFRLLHYIFGKQFFICAQRPLSRLNRPL